MAFTRDGLLERLSSLGIASITRDHPPVFTVEEAQALRGEIAGVHCKNLFLKDAKDQLWLVVCREDTRVDLKALPAKIGAARISFGKADLLREVLGVEPGSVTPFAVINDAGHRVKVVLEAEMMAGGTVNYHPLVNTATTSLAPEGLLRFLASTGHEPLVVSLA